MCVCVCVCACVCVCVHACVHDMHSGKHNLRSCFAGNPTIPLEMPEHMPSPARVQDSIQPATVTTLSFELPTYMYMHGSHIEDNAQAGSDPNSLEEESARSKCSYA